MLSMAMLLAVLFPAPLHLTREVTDPITGGATVVEVYCHGDRVVSVTGKKTAIAEYDKGLLTVIDADAGTYSVTKFDDLARAWSSRAAAVAAPMRVKGDERHLLSREAVEVLLGVAYPDRRDAEVDAAIVSLRSQRRHGLASNSVDAAASEYALPLEQVIQLDETTELKNTVTRVGNELAPPEALTVPPGSRLVKSAAIALRSMLDELDGRRQ